jgi:hypothetical protein
MHVSSTGASIVVILELIYFTTHSPAKAFSDYSIECMMIDCHSACIEIVRV